jgi:hypothetical protein
MFDEHNNRPEDDAGLTSAERELADALRGLRPAGHAIDRDRMLFEAGHAAARRAVFRWRITAVAATILAGAAGVMFASRLESPAAPQVMRELVYVDRTTLASNPARTPEATPPPDVLPVARPLLLASPPGEPDGLLLRERALRWGVSAALSTSQQMPRVRSARPLRIDVNQLLGEPTNVDSADTQPSDSLPKHLLHREQL